MYCILGKITSSAWLPRDAAGGGLHGRGAPFRSRTFDNSLTLRWGLAFASLGELVERVLLITLPRDAQTKISKRKDTAGDSHSILRWMRGFRVFS